MGRAHSNAWRQVGRFFQDAAVRAGAEGGRRSDRSARSKRPRRASASRSTPPAGRRCSARKDIDVVDICTPGDSHAPIAVAAAEAGKAILCEKPLANTVADAERMHAAAKKAGVVNMVCHNYRRCPAVALAKQLIDDGQLGDIHHYRGVYLQDWIVDPKFPRVWRLEKARAGSGSLGDILSHTMDLSRHLVGEPVEVSGLLQDLHRRAAAARRSAAGAARSTSTTPRRRWSSSRTARSATTKARASRPAARTTTASRSTARRGAWSGISSG